MYIYVYIYIYMYVFIYIYMYVYIYVYMLCGDMPAMEGHWWSSRIVSVRTNRVLKKDKGRSIIYI